MAGSIGMIGYFPPVMEAYQKLKRPLHGEGGSATRKVELLYKLMDQVLREHGELALATPEVGRDIDGHVAVHWMRLTQGTFPVRVDKFAKPQRYLALKEAVTPDNPNSSAMPVIHIISTTEQNEEYMRRERVSLGAGNVGGSLASFTEDEYMHMPVNEISDHHVEAAWSVVTYLQKKLLAYAGYPDLPRSVPVSPTEMGSVLPVTSDIADAMSELLIGSAVVAPRARTVYFAQNDELPRG
jgi:hypothetical protein